MRSQKLFLEEAGLDHNAFRQLTGYTTRNRNVQKTQATHIEQKKQDPKKCVVKKQVYTAPNIPEIPKVSKIELPVFKNLVEELLDMSDDTPKGVMHIELLYEVFVHALQKGGIVEVSSIGGFDAIIKNVLISANPEHISQELTPALIQKIRQLLFSVQFLNRNQHLPHRIYELGLINFVDKNQLRQHSKDKVWGLNYFNYDLTLFQEGAQGIDMDKTIFNLDYMCKHYGKQKIDIRIQNPLDYGFKPSKLKNKRYEMTLAEYRFYQQNFMDPTVMKSFKHADQLGKGQVFFGVNFEPSDQMLNKQVKKSVSGTFLDFHGDFDMMSYLDTDVPGCSLPQMYFKTPGCWTGGHQQNVSMSALNINHGPQHSEWFTLDLKYVEGLRKQLIQKFQTDLFSSEGLWYEKLDWFIERGYPVKRFLQRKDDIVVTGPGTLHWVRSFGIAIQTSWNIFPKNYQQFEAAFNRHRINKQIRFHKSDTIPLKGLIMKYLNHQRRTMSNSIRQLCSSQLQKWYNEQEQIIARLNKRMGTRIYYYLKDLESFCSLCKQEVLVYFLPAPVHKERGISCLQCFQKQNSSASCLDQLYYKLDAFLVQKLIEVSKDRELNLLYQDEIQELCKGFHVGDLPIKCKIQKKVQDQSLISQEYKNAPQQQLMTAQKQIYFNKEDLLQLYESIKKVNFSDESKRKNQSKEKIKPNAQNSCGKMMMELEEGQMEMEVIKQEKKVVDAECQTEGKFRQVVEKQAGEISSSSAEKKKKKKKDKSKKKKAKEAKLEQQEESLKFKTSESQERKARASQPRSTQQNQNSSGRYQQREDNNRQNNRNWREGNEGQDNNFRRKYNNEENQGYDRQNNRNWRDNNNRGLRENREDGDNRNSNYNDRGNDRGQNNYGRRGNWNDRNNNYENQNQNRYGENQNEQEQGDGEFNRGRHDQDGNRQRNFQGRGRGRGQGRGRGGGDRGRGRGGRGGFSRDNNYQERNRNNEEGDNNRNEDNVKASQKCEQPDEY